MLDKKLLKAKIELMTRSVFLSTINLSVKHIVTDMVATAGTDCRQIMYNPDFCKNLTIIELTGLMAHECWHIAFMHKPRQGTRNHVLWNKAADYVINNRVNLKLFYDQVVTDYVVSSSFPTSNTNVGVSIRLTLM